MTHAATFVFHSPEIFAARVIYSFYMPLFFFCSGYVSQKVFTRTASGMPLFGRKDFLLLAPFLTLGLLKSVLPDLSAGQLTWASARSLFTQVMNNGYWFFLVLFLFRFSVILAQYAGTKLTERLRFASGGASVVLTLILACPTAWIATRYLSVSVNAVTYFPFYILGFAACYYDILSRWLRHRWSVLLLFVASVAYFVVHDVWLQALCDGAPILSIVSRWVLNACGVYVVTLLCIFSTGGNLLTQWGRYSLEIYALHYFFLVGFEHYLPAGSLASMPPTLSAIICATAAGVTAYLSIGLARMCRLVPHLSMIIFGRK